MKLVQKYQEGQKFPKDRKDKNGQLQRFNTFDEWKQFLKDNYATVTNDSGADSIYGDLPNRIYGTMSNNIDEDGNPIGELTPTGLENLYDAWQFINNGEHNYRKMQLPHYDESGRDSLRVIPTNDRYFKKVIKNYDNLSEEDIIQLANIDYRNMNIKQFFKALPALYSTMKKLDIGVTDIPEIVETYNDYWKDYNITFKTGGRITKKSIL